MNIEPWTPKQAIIFVVLWIIVCGPLLYLIWNMK
jgi:hypothetical protein